MSDRESLSSKDLIRLARESVTPVQPDDDERDEQDQQRAEALAAEAVARFGDEQSSDELIQESADRASGAIETSQERIDAGRAQPPAAPPDATIEAATTQPPPAPSPPPRPVRSSTRLPPTRSGGPDVVRPSDTIGVPPQTAPPKKRSGVRTLIRVAIFGFIAYGILSSILDSSVTVEELSPGTCFQDPGSEVVSDIEPVDCAEPHDYEFIGAVALSGSAYPGEEAVWETAVDQCIASRFEAYVGTSYQDSVWWVGAFTPTQDGWNDGDRSANCLVFMLDASETEIAPHTGSARNSAV